MAKYQKSKAYSAQKHTLLQITILDHISCLMESEFFIRKESFQPLVIQKNFRYINIKYTDEIIWLRSIASGNIIQSGMCLDKT